MRVSCFILAIGLFSNLFTSCKKDIVDPEPIQETQEVINEEIVVEETETETEEGNDNEVEIDWNGCFEFVYPMDVVFPNGTTETVNSDTGLIVAVEGWYDDNPNSYDDPTLAFPVNVLLEGETDPLELNSLDELEDLMDYCHEGDYEECFTFVFPLTIEFPDETTADINSLQEGENLVEAWYDANPTSVEDVALVYPIQVTLDDGTVETINDDEELEGLFDECEEEMEGCFIYDESANVLKKTTDKMKKAN